MIKKESVFISAVVYVADDSTNSCSFIENILKALDYYFQHYEIIIVDDCCKKQKELFEKTLSGGNTNTISVIHMSVKQGIEACLRAGLDASIGDFVFEFDTLEFSFGKELIWDVYQKALEGNDIVSVETTCNSLSRRLFYKIFNKYSKAGYDLNASAFRLVSRRAINRVLTLNMSCAFRQAVYASCGLKNARIEFQGRANSKKARNIELAIDSFLLYTELPKKLCSFSVGTLLFLSCVGIFGALTNSVRNSKWIKKLMMLACMLSLIDILASLVTLIHYARLLLQGRNSNYLIEGIEKVQKG